MDTEINNAWCRLLADRLITQDDKYATDRFDAAAMIYKRLSSLDNRVAAIEQGNKKGCETCADAWEQGDYCDKYNKCFPCNFELWRPKPAPAEKEKPCNETCAKNIVPGIPCTDLKHGYSCWVSSKPAEAEEGEVVWVKGHLSKDGRYVDIARTRFVPVAIMTNELDPAELRTDLIDPTDPAENAQLREAKDAIATAAKKLYVSMIKPANADLLNRWLDLGDALKSAGLLQDVAAQFDAALDEAKRSETIKGEGKEAGS